MSQDRRYARGAEDMQEFIARWLEAPGDSQAAMILRVAANFIRTIDPAAVRERMEQDDAWMRRVAEREIEHVRAGCRARTAAYQERQKRKAAGDTVPPVSRGPKRKAP